MANNKLTQPTGKINGPLEQKAHLGSHPMSRLSAYLGGMFKSLSTYKLRKQVGNDCGYRIDENFVSADNVLPTQASDS